MGDVVFDVEGVLQRYDLDVGIEGLAVAGAGYTSSDVVSPAYFGVVRVVGVKGSEISPEYSDAVRRRWGDFVVGEP